MQNDVRSIKNVKALIKKVDSKGQYTDDITKIIETSKKWFQVEERMLKIDLHKVGNQPKANQFTAHNCV